MIKLSNQLSLPTEAICWKMAILGRTGSGKTNTAVVMAEQMIAAGQAIVILDPQGDWYGLRSKYEIAILGGDHGDVPIEAAAGSVVADFVIEHRQPVLLDLFGLSEGGMVRFAADFAKRLWHKNREPLHVFLDEADLFAPQKVGRGHKAECLGHWQNVVRRGRSRGIGCTMITQRAAVLNKDLLTQADPLFIHRLTASQDLSAVCDYLNFYGHSKAEQREITAQLSKQAVGEALILSPGELQIPPDTYRINKRKSFDSGATPVGGKQVAQKMKKMDLNALQKAMADTIERAKADDPKELKAEIKRLKKELANKVPVIDENAITKAVAACDREWQSVVKSVEGVRDGLALKLNEIHQLSIVNGEMKVEAKPPKRPVHSPPQAPKPKVPKPARREPVEVGDVKLSKCEKKILTALYWLKDDADIDLPKIGVYSGYSSKSGSFGNSMSHLRTLGLVEGRSLTSEGMLLAQEFSAERPTGTELVSWLQPRLSKAESTILSVLINEGGERLSNEQIAICSGYSSSSGSFGNALSKLRTMGVAEGYEKNGGTKAADIFFED